MKYLISQGKYDRATAGMSPTERAEVDAAFAVYPDALEDEPDIEVDQDRIAARYAELLREQHRTATVGKPPVGARRNGKNSWTPPEPFKQLGPGVWTAPAGTPPPWLNVDDLVEELRVEQVADERRALLPRFVYPDPDAASGIIVDVPCAPATAEKPLESMLASMDRLREMNLPGPRRLEAGAVAVDAIAAAAEPATRGWSKDVTGAIGSLAYLTSIPIRCRDDLPANKWRLVDTETGDVLCEGTISPELADYVRALKEHAADVANEHQPPKRLVW